MYFWIRAMGRNGVPHPNWVIAKCHRDLLWTVSGHDGWVEAFEVGDEVVRPEKYLD